MLDQCFVLCKILNKFEIVKLSFSEILKYRQVLLLHTLYVVYNIYVITSLCAILCFNAAPILTSIDYLHVEL